MKNAIMVFRVILFLMSIMAFSQQTVSGLVQDSRLKPLNKALVQIYSPDSTTLKNYSFTDSQGKFSLKLEEKGNYILKVSALNFQTEYKSFSFSQEKISFTIPLNYSENDELDDVVVISHQEVAKLGDDTIKYNLKAIRDSTETNLGDLIQKIPGLELTKEGTVKYNGISIDRVLINGKDFFGTKQQMATANISADMVDGMELLLKNQEDVNLKDFEEDSKIALNVTLNEKSKNRILGNLAVNYGAINKYMAHSNLFKFFNNGNLSWITDANNIGDMPLTVDDYVEIMSVGEEDNSNSNLVNIDNLIPKFIYNEDNLQKKNNVFSALNFTYKTQKWNVKSNLFFNFAKQNEFRKIDQYFTDQDTIHQIYKSENNNFVNRSNAKITYTINKKSNISSDFKFSPSNDNSTENVKMDSDYDNNLKNKLSSISNTLKYVNKFDNSMLLQSKFYITSQKNNSDMGINSTNLNLFEFDKSKLFQTNKYSNTETLLEASLNYKIDKMSFKFISNYNAKNEKFHSLINDSLAKNKIERKIHDFSNSVKWKYDISPKLVSNFSLQIHYYEVLQKNPLSEFLIENNTSISYIMNAASAITLSYNNSYNLPSITDILQEKYILDYQNINSTPNIKQYSFYNTNNFSFGFSNFNQKKEQSFTLNANYSFAPNKVSTNSYYQNGFNNINYVLLQDYKSSTGILLFDRKFRKFPLILKSSYSINLTESQNEINSLLNVNKSTDQLLNIQMFSTFKKLKIQLQAKYQLRLLTSKQSLNQTSFKQFTHDISLNLVGKIKKFDVALNTNVRLQNSDGNHLSFFILSPVVKYHFHKWEINLTTNNILHLNNFQFLNQNNTPYMVEKSIQYVIPGYILFGLKYNL